jgi:hypothetical protein
MIRKKKETGPLTVVRLKKKKIVFCILGQTPLIMNKLSAKAKQQLLLPDRKTRGAAREQSLKHDPYQEFLDAMHKTDDPTAPTVALLPSLSFKNAICGTAKDTPDETNTALMKRHTFVFGEYVNIYGIPKMRMDSVRCANAGRTPDIRTRPVFPEWCAEFCLEFTVPLLNEAAVISLACNAGTMGVGDFRQERGAGNYGTFEVCDRDNPDFKRIKAAGGRAKQAKAIAHPEMNDEDTQFLWTWWQEEALQRGFEFSEIGVK